MPVHGEREDGQNVWSTHPTTPATNVGNRHTQERNLEARREGMVRSTARAMKMLKDGQISEEDFDEVVALNAQGVDMDPEMLREHAQTYLEYEEGNTGNIEKE